MRQAIHAQGKRVRGYRIHIWRGSQCQPPSMTTPLMWREGPPVDEWQRVINDPTTQRAWIIQSGRTMQQFQFRRQR
ncbi:MAG TPA: hypothetical protein VIY29_29440 [Ktedonobacteraceae bacterium]